MHNFPGRGIRRRYKIRFTYYESIVAALWQVLMDGTSIAKRPVELFFIYCPEIDKGAYAPPLARILGARSEVNGLHTRPSKTQ